MYELTKEDRELLKSLEVQLRTALKSNYARNIGDRKMTALKDLWERITGTKYPFSGSCGTCQLKLLIRVAKWLEANNVTVEPEQTLTVNELENKAADKPRKKKAKE